MTDGLHDVLHLSAAQKSLLNAKLDEFGAYAHMRNVQAMASAREEAHTLLDAFCDTTDEAMVAVRKSTFR